MRISHRLILLIALVSVGAAFAGCSDRKRPFPSGAASAGRTTNFSLPATEYSEDQAKYLVDEHKFDGAWRHSIGETDSSDPIVIAVLDSGGMRHADLEGVFVEGGYDLIYGDNDPFVTQEDVLFDLQFGFGVSNHATFVHGVIAALANSVGVTGAAPAVKIRHYRIFTEDGFTTNQAVADGIYLAALDGCDIMSMSFGHSSFGFHTEIREATAFAASRGIIMVGAAGNNGDDLSVYQHYPASYPWVICVGASQRREFTGGVVDVRRAYFSNLGDDVDVYARGHNVVSTFGYRGFFNFDTLKYEVEFGDIYGYWNGTSFSTPMVAALLGIGRSLDRTLDTDRARQLLHDSSFIIEPEKDRLLDAEKFISLLLSSGTNYRPPSGSGTVAAALTAERIIDRSRDDITCTQRCEQRRLGFERSSGQLVRVVGTDKFHDQAEEIR